MKCKIHPRYVGNGKPRSTAKGCTCKAIWSETRDLAAKLEESKKRAQAAKAKAITEAELIHNELEIGEPIKSIDRLIEASKAAKDPSLHIAGAPEGFRLRGASTLVDADGNMVMQWVKTTKEVDDTNSILEAFREAVAVKPLPRAARVKVPAYTQSDLMTLYPIGDAHFGMLSWKDETGEDFDIQIARRNLSSAFDSLIDVSPASDVGMIVNLGDGLHADGFTGHTTAGTRVDIDSRWPKMVQVFIETLNFGIQRALEKHKLVYIVNVRGNHDDLSSLVLAMCMAAYWKDEPRVIVVPNTNVFYWHEFGKCLLGFTHGHTVRTNNLPGIMAHDQAEAWGRTKHRAFYLGHVHHEKKQEFPGVVVEYFRTLAAKDAWHHASGYRAGRSMVCDVWHKTRGRILRHEIGIEDL